jgi:hypothetical protein
VSGKLQAYTVITVEVMGFEILNDIYIMQPTPIDMGGGVHQDTKGLGGKE